MKSVIPAGLALGLLGFALPPAQAQGDTRTQEVRFAPGKTGTTLRGSLRGEQSALYSFGAEAGQTITIKLKPSNRSTYFNLYQPGRGPGDQAMAIGELAEPLNQFAGKAPLSGTYTVSIFLVRAAARRNERTSYRLDIGVSALADPKAPVKADFADGLQGGPDFWEVVGVAKGDMLNIHRGPSAKDPIVLRVDNGARLRNKGCRMNGAQRWCLVEQPEAPGKSGWAAGRYLREGG